MPPHLVQTRETTIFAVPLVRIITASLLLIALLNGQRSLALLSILVLSVALGASLWSRISVKALTFRSSLNTSRVFPGEAVKLTVQARNEKILPVSLKIRVEGFDKGLGPLEGDVPLFEAGLLWYEEVAFEYQFTALKRGIYQIGNLLGTVADLLGFFQREVISDEELELVVYPKVYQISNISLPRKELFGIPGDKNPVTDPVFILGTRDYQRWRPARYIHWKASARRQVLQEKLFQPSTQEKVLLIIGVAGFEDEKNEPMFERAIEAAASFAVHLERQGAAVGFATDALLAGSEVSAVPLGRGSGQTARILEALARLRPRKQTDIAERITKAIRTSQGVTCVHFTSGDEASDASLALFLKRRRIPVLRVLCDKERLYSMKHDAHLYRDIHVDDLINPSPPSRG